jgi:hydrogenase maturation protein HypF
MNGYSLKRFQYKIKGQVQGVGFRPFIYQLSKQFSLDGFVTNNNLGVIIEIEGEYDSIKSFENSLENNLPILAKIDNIEKNELDPLYTGQFEIIQSERDTSTSKIVSISPDIAICSNCVLDIKSTSFEYEFKYFDYFSTNCTNCGPRYSIIQTVPYDRVNTSMSRFKLCKSCEKDYNDPLNRRFHAQPTSCKHCGPALTLSINNQEYKNNNIYEKISKLIKSGKIGAIKGIGGFHIVCDATNDTTINSLRKFKNRPTKPFAIMCKDIQMINQYATLSKMEQTAIQSKEAPIVLLKKENHKDLFTIAPNIDRIGCMLPYSAFYHILFDQLDCPIVATSANLGGDPILTSKDDIIKYLPFIDFVVDYNRDIVNSVDDSVVQIVDDNLQILRLSRGYAPKEIKLSSKIDKKILSLGANQKSTISLAFDDKIVLSPYIANLDGLKSIEYFNRTIETFKRFYDFKPDVIVYDMHNGYESSKIANQIKLKYPNIEFVQVQHHLAHLYSVKAEFNLPNNKYIGFIFDGTGLGIDNKLWGGEVFVENKRKYHFKPIKLLGGEKAIKECKRVALGLLFQIYTLDEIFDLDIPTIKSFKEGEIRLLHNMYNKDLNSPSSSSVGRLFDAIASISGICQVQSYEGEAGLLCEMKYNYNVKEYFDYSIDNNIIDIKFEFDSDNIVSKFINTLVKIIIDICQFENLPMILSGGVFQNKTLLELIINECKIKNIGYYYNQQIPTNDSGVSVGQIKYYLDNF